ncbi:secreted RxLR effector peptide protein, putative [Phytophthora infestans T30-4]|uniref:Secreted RxLR effector peptide protein n=2 Tax=Phytophthora infestans TaxID=4787 RepID=A0A833SXH8_PHYIN
MRLLLWVLIATLAIFVSSCEAASFDKNKPLPRVLSSKSTSHVRAVENAIEIDTRRGDSGRDETEERGIAQTIADKAKSISKRTVDTSKHLSKRTVELWRRLKAWYLKKEAGILERRFKELVAEKKTYADVNGKLCCIVGGGRLRQASSGFSRSIMNG